MVDGNLAIGEDDDVVVNDGLELLGAGSPALDLEESALDEGRVSLEGDGVIVDVDGDALVCLGG